jgi:hypothetical protein
MLTKEGVESTVRRALRDNTRPKTLRIPIPQELGLILMQSLITELANASYKIVAACRNGTTYDRMKKEVRCLPPFPSVPLSPQCAQRLWQNPPPALSGRTRHRLFLPMELRGATKSSQHSKLTLGASLSALSSLPRAQLTWTTEYQCARSRVGFVSLSRRV